MREIVTTARKCVTLVGRDNVAPAAGVLAGSLLASVFEILGLSLILGVLTVLVAEGDAATALPAVLPVDALRAFPLWAVLLGIFAAYLLKSATVLTVRWWTARYTALSEARFAAKVLGLYLHAPYAEVTRLNSAHVMQKVEQQTAAVFTGTVMSTLTMLSNLVLLVGASGALVFIDPVMTGLGLAFFAVITPVYLKASGPLSRRLGYEAGALGKAYTKLLQEALHALKEIRVTDSAAVFLDNFGARRTQYAHVRARKTVLAAVAPLIMELLAVAAAMVLFFGMIEIRGGQGSIVLMGTFAAALSRIIGYVNGIVTGVNQISFARPAIDELYDDMRRLSVEPEGEAAPSRRTPFTALLKVDGVFYSHTGDERAHLDSVTVEVPFGSAVAVVGQSGAGKSTLVDVMVGLLPPHGGTVMVDGRPIAADPRAWRAGIGYVSQSFYLIDDTIRRNVGLGLTDDAIDDTRVLRALRDAGLESFLSAQPLGLDTVVGDRGQALSGGQRQRIAIARALYRDPVLLILDEATSALDPTTELHILDQIEGLKSRMAVILVTHRLSAAARCDRIYYLRDGRVVHHGTYDEVRSATQALGDDFFARAH